MSFDQFENQARLYVVGALDDEERATFEQARESFGDRAEAVLEECQVLNAAFALSLRPNAPKLAAKERLMSLVQRSLRENGHTRRQSDPPDWLT